MVYDPAKFQTGALVRVADRAALDDFARTWKFHNPLQAAQLEFAGHIAKIISSGMYHGGDMLYQLEGVPGIWHEQLLSSP